MACGVSAMAIMTSCGGGDKWHIDGKISGLADSDIVVLEGSNQGYWYPMDTLDISSDGSFKYSHEAQGYPDIYRLRVGDNSIYFPIDSIETVTITADAPDIAGTHTIKGTPQALNLFRVDSMLVANGDAAITNQNLKRQLGQMLLADPAGIVTYYIISKKVDGKPLFNPAVKEDLRLIGAVANAFSEKRPSDPRTGYLKRLYLDNRPSSSTSSNQLVASEVKAFEINLFDNAGKAHSLLELTESGKVVLLNFTAYTAEDSPAFNVALNKVYEKYHQQGLEIYQVSVDNDEYTWKQTAKNLPWITVLNNIADGGEVLNKYNVVSIPTIFLFNRNGELVSRVTDINTLDSEIARLL